VGWKGVVKTVTMGGVAIPRVDKFKYLAQLLSRKEISMRVLTIVLEWGGKNGRVPMEFCMISKFL